ncbi:MAG: hypothetical protein GKR96_01680 [Gammaproteobacteria bacterium]|nr:hypothetical protein [Gammaproteobacteria bacterium]
MSVFAIVGLVVTVISAVACHKIADRKGLSPVFWGVMGILFGPFAVLVVLAIRSKKAP